MNYQTLKTEIDTDPLVRGYAGMSDAQVAASLSTANRSGIVPAISGSDLFDCIAPAEFNALTAEQKANLRAMWAMPTINITDGSNGRTMLLALFGAQSTTRAAIVAKASQNITRAQELGLGRVDWMDVHRARNRSN